MDRAVVWSLVSLAAFLVGLDLGINKQWAECPARNGQDPLVSSVRAKSGEVTCNYVASLAGRTTYSLKRGKQ